ncbi:RHS repeat domain-containing protein [Leptospira ainazelensis]|uniref:RHS repeat domain-containing protein n=1 Tax=Leptospira ainazelensis TaxID=2810034 RepID=UPI001E4A8729|nr:RHS repeat-associated core domain-containing protein [Leptospira ainazelensis]
MNYAYDASGNMISRNGDVLRYDSFGKLIEITPNGGTSSINYNYDYSGNRIKAVSDAALTTTYSFGDSYEIVRASGLPEKHTVYVKGIEGEIVAQWTREDATLQLSDSATEDGSQVATSIVGTLTKRFCKDVSIDCGDYWKNWFGKEIYSFIGYSSYFQEGVPTKLYNALYFLILLGVLYLAYPYFLRGNTLLHELSWKGTATPALLLAMFVITSLPGCGILPGGSGQGDPPWVLAMGANVNPSVPSIQNGNSGASGGGINGGTPVNGMFFYHPDHLGSVNMITDGYGNPASGPEPGVSYVSYEPYGSINRNDSYGPDIFRYKYTGQVEDKESGLYFYKARYYEPTLGRFLQADSLVMPNSPNGMNRYMYVDGNPVNFRDPSGHVGLKGLIHMFNRIVGHAMGKDFDSKNPNKRVSSGGVKNSFGKINLSNFRSQLSMNKINQSLNLVNKHLRSNEKILKNQFRDFNSNFEISKLRSLSVSWILPPEIDKILNKWVEPYFKFNGSDLFNDSIKIFIFNYLINQRFSNAGSGSGGGGQDPTEGDGGPEDES